MAANDFDSSEISGSGQQDDSYRDDEDRAFYSASPDASASSDSPFTESEGGVFPRPLTPRKFEEDDDVPVADMPHGEAMSPEERPLEDLALEAVPPMEPLPVPAADWRPPTGRLPSPYDLEEERYAGRRPVSFAPLGPLAEPMTVPTAGTVRAGAAGGSRAAGARVRPGIRGPATPMAAPVDTAPAPAEDLDPVRPVVAETSDMLTADWLLHGRRAQPTAGWRRAVYRASGGLVKVGESAATLRRRDLNNRVRTPVAGGHHRVAVMSLKGGVGKTTTAVGLGATLASLRGDRIIAMDANPDRGTLSDKVRLETGATVRDLLNERSEVSRYADIRQFTSQGSSRLEILASERDPGVSIAFSADDYREVCHLLEHYYSIAITDCGTGLLHSAMSGILELADHIVLVSSPSVDGARSASATLDWLEAHRYTDLVRDAVVVISTIRPRSRSTVDLDRLEAHFASRCRDVIRVPYDAHLEEGAEVELDLMSTGTRDAYLALAATVADGFAVPRRSMARPATWLP
jgi:MinD-like ATPase involved in chromosome partitioning or flagellar assembly